MFVCNFKNPPKSKNRALRAVYMKEFAWPNNTTIHVTFKNFTSSEKNSIKETVLRDLSPLTPGLNFHFRQDAFEAGDIRVQKSEFSNSSALGTQALEIDPSISTMKITDAFNKRIIRHEFGHVCGLLHEHQNPNADMIDIDKAYSYYFKTRGWVKAIVDQNVLSPPGTTYSEFDESSVMTYDIPAEITKDGKAYPRGNDYSDIDKLWLRRMYPGEDNYGSDVVGGGGVGGGGVGGDGVGSDVVGGGDGVGSDVVGGGDSVGFDKKKQNKNFKIAILAMTTVIIIFTIILFYRIM